MSGRNWQEPRYLEWRRNIKKRDNYTCQMPGCGSKKKIKVHHIIPWAKNPGLRFVETNGICLCRRHHDAIWKKENFYAPLFMKIVRRKYEK